MDRFFRRSKREQTTGSISAKESASQAEYAQLVEQALGLALQYQAADLRLYEKRKQYKERGRQLDNQMATILVKESGQEANEDLEKIHELSNDLLNTPPNESQLHLFHEALFAYLVARHRALGDDNICFAVMMLSNNRRQAIRLSERAEYSSIQAENALAELKTSIRNLHGRSGPMALRSAGLTSGLLIWLYLDDLAEAVSQFEQPTTLNQPGVSPSSEHQWSLTTVPLKQNRKVDLEGDPFLHEFAKNIRIRMLCERHHTSIPAELKTFDTLSEELKELGRSPERWRELSPNHLKLLLFERTLSHGFMNDAANSKPLADLYAVVEDRLSVDERKLLVADVSLVLNSSIEELWALLIFIYADHDVSVISTAILNYACIYPVTDDRMAGPRACLARAGSHPNDEVMMVGVLQGLISLGDVRVLPIIDDCWHRLSVEAKTLLSQSRTDASHAGSIAFWLRWLAGVDENDFGYAAGVLSGMAARFESAPIRHIRRVFPSPFTMSEEERELSPPVQILNEWTREEFAHVIEPQLRLNLLRETYDKVMLLVMQEWGIDVGDESHTQQMARIFELHSQRCQTLKQLAPDGMKISWSNRTPGENANILISSMFDGQLPTLALHSVLEISETMIANAGEKMGEAIAMADSTERQVAMNDAEAFRQCGTAVQMHLRQVLGPDLDAVKREFARIAQLGAHDYI